MVPNDWEVKKLEDVVSKRRKITYGIVVPGPYEPNGNLMIRAKDYSFGWQPIESIYRVSDKMHQSYKRSQVRKGDVLLTIVGSIGNTAIVPEGLEGANITQQTARLSFDEHDANFFYSIMSSEIGKKEIYRYAKSGVQPSLNLADIAKFKIPVPPFPEQQKIAKILSTWDNAISTTERLIDNSTQQKKALMQQLLTGKQRLFDDEGKRFKGDWDEVTIDSTFKLITDYVASGSFASLKENVNVSDDEGYAHYVRQTDLAAKFKNKTLKWVNEDSYSYLKKSNLYEGDILFTNIGDLGKVFYMPKLEKPATVAPNLIVLRVNQKNNSKYIFYMLSSYVGQRQINRIKSGTGLPKINKTEFKTMRFKIPRLEEQQKVATVLTNADKEIELLEQQLSDLQQEKKALMQVLLTGKVRVVVDG